MSMTTPASMRIASLLDENSFVEIGGQITARATDFNMKPEQTPSDGVITGYGVIEDKPVYVYSQDASVLGGSVGEMHAAKIVRLYELALKTGSPVIGLIDSAGLRLQEAGDALNAFGELYRMQTRASGVIPQITAVFGSCGGGLALIPALTDFTFMEEKKARLFVNSPNALAGNEVSRCDTAAAAFQGAKAGLVDVAAGEESLFAQIRELIALLPSCHDDRDSSIECVDNLNRACAELTNCGGDTGLIVTHLADNHYFFETKRDYAREMLTGFLRLNGVTIGVVANRTEIYGADGARTARFEPLLTVQGCRKAAGFVGFCDAFGLPLLTLANAKGFEATACGERDIAREAAGLARAFARAVAPKVNLVTGEAFGSAYTVMNSPALGADMTFAWPQAKIGMMDSSLAAKIICDGQGAEAIESCAKAYDDLQNSVKSAAARGYVDAVIEPRDTRKYLIGAFELLYSKKESRSGGKR